VIVVLIASKMGLPISSTHCKIGSVIAMGMLHDISSVKWKVIGNIFITWIVTLPCSALLSAGFALFLKWYAL
jgi:phosphate/sulfate permease